MADLGRGAKAGVIAGLIMGLLAGIIGGAVSFVFYDEIMVAAINATEQMLSNMGMSGEEIEQATASMREEGMNVLNEGSGFGLYITKKIIELHDGKIWIESEGRMKGSTFYISIPIINE